MWRRNALATFIGERKHPMSSFATQLSDSLASVVDSVGPSVVRIEGGRNLPSSGVAWSSEHIVTVSHALDREEGLQVGLADGTTLEATLVGRDPATDLAVLKVAPGKLTPAKPGGEAQLKVGHLLLALGRPGKTARALLGMASAVGGEWRTHGGGRLDRYVQLDVGRQPGFSGGAIANTQGEVIGIGTAGLSRGAVLAIPRSTVDRVTASILAGGSVKRGFLGVGVFPVRLPGPIAQQLSQGSGALVISVQPGSAAEKGGLFLGDVLVTLDGKPVTQPSELIELLDEDRVGKPLAATILRAGAVQTLNLTVGTRS